MDTVVGRFVSIDIDNASVTGSSDNVKTYEEELYDQRNFALIVRRETVKEQPERACRRGIYGL